MTSKRVNCWLIHVFSVLVCGRWTVLLQYMCLTNTYPCQLSFEQTSLGFAPLESRQERWVPLGVMASEALTAPGKLKRRKELNKLIAYPYPCQPYTYLWNHTFSEKQPAYKINVIPLSINPQLLKCCLQSFLFTVLSSCLHDGRRLLWPATQLKHKIPGHYWSAPCLQLWDTP